jgi:DNA-binding GntR family transcriptional regulator
MIAAHERLADALVGGDPARAEAALALDLAQGRDAIRAALAAAG